MSDLIGLLRSVPAMQSRILRERTSSVPTDEVEGIQLFDEGQDERAIDWPKSLARGEMVARTFVDIEQPTLWIALDDSLRMRRFSRIWRCGKFVCAALVQAWRHAGGRSSAWSWRGAPIVAHDESPETLLTEHFSAGTENGFGANNVNCHTAEMASFESTDSTAEDGVMSVWKSLPASCDEGFVITHPYQTHRNIGEAVRKATSRASYVSLVVVARDCDFRPPPGLGFRGSPELFASNEGTLALADRIPGWVRAIQDEIDSVASGEAVECRLTVLRVGTGDVEHRVLEVFYQIANLSERT